MTYKLPPKPPPLPPFLPSDPPLEPFRVADTPPSGTLVGLPRPALGESDAEAPGPGPQEMARLIRGLRQDRRQAATRAVSDVAKYTTLAVGVLGIAAQVASQFKPGLVGPIQTLIQLLGGAP